MREVNNREDILDSRDIDARIEEIETEQDSLVEEFEEALEAATDAADEFTAETDPIIKQNGYDPSGELTEAVKRTAEALCSFWGFDQETSYTETAEELIAALRNPEDGFLGDEELAALVAFRDEMQPYCDDWQYGEALIRDSYFEEYARQLAEDIGAIDSDAKWPATCIDWKEAAEQLKQDYTSAEFDGVTYWGR